MSETTPTYQTTCAYCGDNVMSNDVIDELPTLRAKVRELEYLLAEMQIAQVELLATIRAISKAVSVIAEPQRPIGVD